MFSFIYLFCMVKCSAKKTLTLNKGSMPVTLFPLVAIFVAF